MNCICRINTHRGHREDVETVIHSDKNFASVAFLKVKRARLEKKESSTLHTVSVRSPAIMDDVDERVYQSILSGKTSLSSSIPVILPIDHEYRANDAFLRIRKSGPWVVMSNVESTIRAVSVEEEVRNCFVNIQGESGYLVHNGGLTVVCVGRLAEYSLSLSHIANINMLISSMELFPVINAIYASFFGTSPPARACVAADLPTTTHLRLECIAYDESRLHERKALHVQSLSYWAPANIGPYSQAIKVTLQTVICQLVYAYPGWRICICLGTNWACSFR